MKRLTSLLLTMLLLLNMVPAAFAVQPEAGETENAPAAQAEATVNSLVDDSTLWSYLDNKSKTVLRPWSKHTESRGNRPRGFICWKRGGKRCCPDRPFESGEEHPGPTCRRKFWEFTRFAGKQGK